MPDNRHNFRVIYGDTDMMGVVYYANYLRYFEAGRSELMRALDIPYKMFEEQGFLLPVTDVTVRYHASATYDDELSLLTKVEKVRRGSVRIGYELTRPADDKLIASGEPGHACIGPEGRITRFPAAIVEKLNGPQLSA